jgi:hypothetical protein
VPHPLPSRHGGSSAAGSLSCLVLLRTFCPRRGGVSVAPAVAPLTEGAREFFLCRALCRVLCRDPCRSYAGSRPHLCRFDLGPVPRLSRAHAVLVTVLCRTSPSPMPPVERPMPTTAPVYALRAAALCRPRRPPMPPARRPKPTSVPADATRASSHATCAAYSPTPPMLPCPCPTHRAYRSSGSLGDQLLLDCLFTTSCGPGPTSLSDRSVRWPRPDEEARSDVAELKPPWRRPRSTRNPTRGSLGCRRCVHVLLTILPFRADRSATGPDVPLRSRNPPNGVRAP